MQNVAANVTTDLASASNLYAIAKGLGEVALTAVGVVNPAAAALIQAGIAIVDPIIAKVQAGATVAGQLLQQQLVDIPTLVTEQCILEIFIQKQLLKKFATLSVAVCYTTFDTFPISTSAL